jgi:hypothetical protein
LEGVQLGVQELLELARGVLAAGLRLAVPLLEPEHQLVQAHQHGHQSVFRPAVFVLALLVQGHQGLCALQMIPAGPTDERARIAVLFAAGVGDEALFGHVELAAQAPVVGVAKVFLVVLRRNGDVADGLAEIFAALQGPGLAPGYELLEPIIGKK